MMLAAWYKKNGSAEDVLRVGQQPIPEPVAGEVRVRLVCSGVNPSDVKSRAGSRPVRWDHIVPHSDGAGVIDKVGQGVDPNRIGERVWVWNAQYNRPNGTAAQYVTLPSMQAVTLFDDVSFEAGACLGIPVLTAYRAVELAELEPGQTLLVIGGASGVGFYIAQMARARGARVIATVGSSARATLLHQHDLAETIFYKDEPVSERVLAMTNGGGVNAIIDMDFSTTIDLVEQGVLAPHGRFVCYGSNNPEPRPISYATWLARSLSLHFFLVYELTPVQRARTLAGVQSMLRDGLLKHNIGLQFDLSDIVAAHQVVESGSALGNVIVNCAN